MASVSDPRLRHHYPLYPPHRTRTPSVTLRVAVGIRRRVAAASTASIGRQPVSRTLVSGGFSGCGSVCCCCRRRRRCCCRGGGSGIGGRRLGYARRRRLPAKDGCKRRVSAQGVPEQPLVDGGVPRGRAKLAGDVVSPPSVGVDDLGWGWGSGEGGGNYWGGVAAVGFSFALARSVRNFSVGRRHDTVPKVTPPVRPECVVDGKKTKADNKLVHTPSPPHLRARSVTSSVAAEKKKMQTNIPLVPTWFVVLSVSAKKSAGASGTRVKQVAYYTNEHYSFTKKGKNKKTQEQKKRKKETSNYTTLTGTPNTRNYKHQQNAKRNTKKRQNNRTK